MTTTKKPYQPIQMVSGSVSDAEAAAAEAAILASLEEWTSPHLGHGGIAAAEAVFLSPRHTNNNDSNNSNSDWNSYERDPVEWLQRQEKDVDDECDDEEDLEEHPHTQTNNDGRIWTHTTPAPPPPRGAFQRAGTPIMSNSSNTTTTHKNTHANNTPFYQNRQQPQQRHEPTTRMDEEEVNEEEGAPDNDNDIDDMDIPFNVESPWAQSSNHGHRNRQHTPDHRRRLASTASATPPTGAAARVNHNANNFANGTMLSTTTPVNQNSTMRRTMMTKSPQETQKGSAIRQSHEAVAVWIAQTRHIQHQRQEQDQHLSLVANENRTTAVAAADDDERSLASVLRRRHRAADLQFLSALTTTVHAGSSSSLPNNTHNYQSTAAEGNFWKLLHALIQLNTNEKNDAVSSLLWNDAATADHNASIDTFVEGLAAVHTETTPAQLVAKLTVVVSPQPMSNDDGDDCDDDDDEHGGDRNRMAPLAWRRRYQIRQWLEQCFQQQQGLTQGTAHPRRTKIDTLGGANNQAAQRLLRQGFYATDKDEELLRACLDLILAGQLPRAQTLLRDSGVAWRAGLWDGGAPHDVRCVPQSSTTALTAMTTTDGPEEPLVVYHNTGNPRRALWRNVMWKHAEKLGSDRLSCQYETAIVALLSSNVNVALDCSALRTWERGLYAIWRAWTDRTIDELLHAHNNNRRRQEQQPTNSLPFPGTECERSERDHLNATATLHGHLGEAQVVGILDSTPFEEMRIGHHDRVLQATASVLIGKGAIVAFMEDSLDALINDPQSVGMEESDLRFLTHVAIFWHTMSSHTNIVVERSQDWQNLFVYFYIHHLASKEGLWDMIVLYASLLPANQILNELPEILRSVEGQKNRAVVVNQLFQYLAEDRLDLAVLRRIVHLILSETETNKESRRRNMQHQTPSNLDVRKMKAILWLCIRENHHEAALLAANTLLRQFFRSRKIASACMLVGDEMLGDLLGQVVENDKNNEYSAAMQTTKTAMEIDNGSIVGDNKEQIQQAIAEHACYLLFLEAMKAVQHWQTIVASKKWSFPDWSSDRSNSGTTALILQNDVERSFADNAERRQRVLAIRQASAHVVKSAHTAQRALKAVLEYPGGWLLTTDEEEPITIDDSLSDPDSWSGHRQELERLRQELLPETVMMYHDVCAGTADWMSTSMKDAMECLGSDLSCPDVIRYIVGEAEHKDNLPASTSGTADGLYKEWSPLTPWYWTQQALKLPMLVENDVYNVRSAYDTASYKNLVAQLAETAVLDLKYSASMCTEPQRPPSK